MTFKNSSQVNNAGSASDERIFHPMFERHAAIMLLIEPQTGAILDANQSAVNFYGYSKAQLCKMFIHEINMLSSEQVAAERQKALSEERNYFVFPHKLSSGEKRIVEVHSSPIVWQEKQALFSIIHDITERKQAEEALAKSEAMLQKVQEVAHMGSWAIDLTTKMVVASDEAHRIYGIPQDSMTLAYIQSVSLPEFRPLLDAALAALITEGKRYDVEFKIQRHSDGEIRDIHSIAEYNPLSRMIIGSVQDVTERKQVEEALRKSEQMLHNVIGNFPGVVFWKDTQSNYLGCNHSFAAGAGLNNPIEIIGKTDFDLPWKTTEAANYRADDREVMESGKAKLHIVEMQHQIGNRVTWFDTSKIPLRDSKGQVIGVLGVSTDITERKQAEEARIISEANLQALINNRNESIWSLDNDYNLIVYNDYFRNVYHAAYNVELKTGLNLLDILSPELRAFWKPKYDAVLSGQKTSFEFKETVQETVFYFEVFLNPIISGEKITGASVLSVDITERKRVEDALRESEEKYRLSELDLKEAQAVAHIGNWKWNLKTGDITWSDEMYRIFGIDQNSYTGRLGDVITKVVHPDDLHMVLPSNAREFVEKKPIEYRIILADKSIHTIWAKSGDAVLDDEGNPIFLTGIAQDITERRQAEEALRDSEEMFRVAFDNAPTGMSIIGAAGFNYLAVNPLLCEMFGYTREEILGKTVKLVTHPDDVERSNEWIRKKYNDEPCETDFEKRYIHKDGHIVWGLVRAQWIRNEDGSPRMAVNHIVDITERKQAEEAAQESRARFQGLVETLNEWIWEVNTEGYYTYTSPQVEDLLGYTPEEVLGKTAFDFMPLEEAQRVSEVFGSFLSAHLPLVNLENVNRRKDGSLVVLETSGSPFYNAQGEFKGYRGIDRDITARKQAEEALRKSEALYRQAIEVANAVPYHQTYHVNRQTIDYDFIGEGICQITGYRPEEFNEALWDSLIQESVLLDDLAGYSWLEAIERVRSGVSPVWKCNHRIRAHDGKIRWVFEAAVELRDENGISHGSIGMFQDITERKQAEDELHQLNMLLEQRVVERTAQLENTNKELEAFSYSVSHDLRAPLRGIDGWSQALLEDYHDQLDEQGRQYIDRVRSETQRMGHLIDDLLKLSRLARAEMVKEQVNLSALAQAIAGRLKQDEPHRQVDFNISAGLTAEGDPHLLEVVLTNLLGNAFKFTAKRTDARIEFGQIESQDQRVFFIRDNGAGFDMAYSQKLFGAFQRMHKVSEFPGTGVGLATVQRIIHRHGGRVWAEAEPGRGATFYFTLE